MSPQRSAVGHPLKTDAVAASVLVLFGLAYGVLAWREGVGTTAETGPGFFPFAVAVVLVISSATVVLQEWRSNSATVFADEGDDEFQGDIHWWRISGVLLASLAVPLVGGILGFVVTLSIAFVVIAKVMGLSGWVRPALMGVVFGAVVWLTFVQWLFVPLPSGILGLA